MKTTEAEIDLLLQSADLRSRMDKKRNMEIYRAHKAGESFVAIGKRYGLTADLVSTICGQEQFREQDPLTASLCEQHGGFQRAAWLWVRGYEIIPPGDRSAKRR